MPAVNGLMCTNIGEINFTLNPIDANSMFANGLAFSSTGQLHITVTPNASDFYNSGRRFSSTGALVVGVGDAPNRPYFCNRGWPTRISDAGTVYQVDQVPSAADPYVGGVCIGGLGGVYVSTLAPA